VSAGAAMRSSGSIWDTLTPMNLYGVRSPSQVPDLGGARMVGPGIERSAGASLDDDVTAPAWHPNNPLFWFGAVLLATFGLVGFSTTFRAGPAQVAAQVGKTRK
jgi:hypothetical protein